MSEVQLAKSLIETKSSGSVYFDVPINNSIKQSIEKNLGLDLSNNNKVPIRWIKGYTQVTKILVLVHLIRLI
jgi:hypothetical protein